MTKNQEEIVVDGVDLLEVLSNALGVDDLNIAAIDVPDWGGGEFYIGEAKLRGSILYLHPSGYETATG